MAGRELDLDDVRAELRGDMCGVRADVNRGLARLADRRTARVRPDHDDEPRSLGFLRVGANLLIHAESFGGSWVDGEADPDAPESERVGDAPGERRIGIPLVAQRVVIVDLQD